MAADREEVNASEVPRKPAARLGEPAWERGKDVEELAVSVLSQKVV